MSRYVPPRRPQPYGAIYTAPVPQPPDPPKEPDVNPTVKIEQYISELDDPILLGARQRYRDEVLLPRDRVSEAFDENGTHANHRDMMTGGAAMFFDRGYIRDYLVARFRGQDVMGASVAGLIGAATDYKRAVGIEQPPPVPPPSGTINGRLRVENGRLRDDAGFVNYQAMSAFCLIGHAIQGRRDEVIRQLDRAARAGRNAVRVFAMLDPQNGGFGPVTRFDPFMDGWNVAANFVVNEAAARGLRVQINIFADAQRLFPAHASRRSAVHTVAGALKAHDAVWFRLANEPYQNGWSGADDPQILELADLLADLIGHRDFAIGDVKDDGSESGSPENREQIRRVAERCNFLVVHSDRAEQPGRERPIEHMKSVHETYEAVARDKWMAFDENRGFASARQPGRRDNRASVAMAECCTAAILGRGYTYHHIAEQDDATPGLAESAVAATIPVDPSYRFKNAGTGGAWVQSFGGWMKVRTCANGADGWAIAHGPSGSIEPAGQVVAQVDSDGLRATLYRK